MYIYVPVGHFPSYRKLKSGPWLFYQVFIGQTSDFLRLECNSANLCMCVCVRSWDLLHGARIQGLHPRMVQIHTLCITTYTGFEIVLVTFSSHLFALALMSAAPPEMTPLFWNRVPSRATAC